MLQYFIFNDISPGIKFNVQSKGLQIPFGTMAYMSYLLGTDENDPNTVYNNIIIIRRGLKGKDRICTDTLSTGLYNCKIKEINNILINNKNHELKIIESNTNITNLLTEDYMNFFGWLLSIEKLNIKLDNTIYTQFIQTLAYKNKTYKNIYATDTDTLLYGYTYSIENDFEYGLESLLNKYVIKKERLKLINELNSQSHKLILPRYHYNSVVCDVKIAALIHIKNIIVDLTIKEIKNIKTKIINELKQEIDNLSNIKNNIESELEKKLQVIKHDRIKIIEDNF